MSSNPPSAPEPSQDTRGRRTAKALRKLDSSPALLRAAQAARNMLPGDRDYGDRLSMAGSEAPQLIGQRLTALTAERPSALREVGFSALQVWQSVSEARGRGRGDEELAGTARGCARASTWASLGASAGTTSAWT